MCLQRLLPFVAVSRKHVYFYAHVVEFLERSWCSLFDGVRESGSSQNVCLVCKIDDAFTLALPVGRQVQ